MDNLSSLHIECECDSADIYMAIHRMFHHRQVVEFTVMDNNVVWEHVFESLLCDGTPCPVHPRMFYLPVQSQSFL
jgi:hypothetical protein